MNIDHLTSVDQNTYETFLVGTSFNEETHTVCGREVVEHSDGEIQAIKSTDLISNEILYYINQ